MQERRKVRLDGEWYEVMADVPKRCKHVWDLVCGGTLVFRTVGGVREFQTEHVRNHGTWRYIDLQQLTGRSSSDVKMRELARLNPHLFDKEYVQSEKSAARYATYKLRRGVLKPAAQAGGR